MSAEVIGAPAPPHPQDESTIVISDSVVGRQPEAASKANAEPHLDKDAASKNDNEATGLHSPPDSNNAMKLDGSDSELSDLEDVADESAAPAAATADATADATATMAATTVGDAAAEPAPPPKKDIGEITPDHWSGTVPVFKPTMEQFEDFTLFMEKIDSYGMKSGIVKVIPPDEWKSRLPEYDQLVKQVRVREPIKQDIMGSNGTYRQVNILHQRSYNLPQWRALCDQSEHQPPARRGERRANVEKPKAAPKPRAAPSSTPKSRTTKGKKGRFGRRKTADKTAEGSVASGERPMTPVSPAPEADKPVESVEQDSAVKEEYYEEYDDTPIIRRMGFVGRGGKTQSTSARRKYIKREGSAKIDEAAFKDWDYRMDVSDYTPERCEELERTYWKTLTYAPPLYGADLPGTLFDDSTTSWNLNKLPNLLDVLGTKIPGVNTAYLYLGMWKATFAWHLEDVDLYSINYLHFGAPKQWYSISQKDARRFEAAMKNIWPTDAKACDQFLRHKAFLISPQHLQQQYNIKVNKVVSYPGEFVVTYPYGYHSGYNLGYNCAEAVNFALDPWLPMGKIAKKCECAQAQDSVWIDVYDIERKLRGEETDYEDTEDEEDEEDDDESMLGLPTPQSGTIRIKGAKKKRKRPAGEKEGKPKTRKIRLRLKPHVEPPCCLCPNDIPGAEILRTDDGRKAHRMCALYLPETYIEAVDGTEMVFNISHINKARLDLKCLYCRSKRGACFQCSQRKCARSYHATCAAAAGVFVEEADIPVFGEDGTEYKEQAFEFSCRFHRTKRDKKLDSETLDDNTRVRDAAAALKKHDIAQMQYYRGDIFAGVIIENRHSERTFLLDIIPNGDRVEVEWKWLLLPEPADLHLPKASSNALPMPASQKAKDHINKTKRAAAEVPRAEEPFVDGCTWAEFHTGEPKNPTKLKVDMFKDNQIWHYLGKPSTEAKAQYTENPARQQHNPKSNYLDSLPKEKAKPTASSTAAQPRRSTSAVYPTYPPGSYLAPTAAMAKAEKPYQYKPREAGKATAKPAASMQFTTQKFMPPSTPLQQQYSQARHSTGSSAVPNPFGMGLAFGSDPRFKPSASYSADRFAAPLSVATVNNFPSLPGVNSNPAGLLERYSPPQPKSWGPNGSPLGSVRSRSSSSVGSKRPVSALGGQLTAQQLSQQAQNQQNLAKAYQKYSFFQIHHNRDAARYRTPYAAWGGFTNGYEGNLRAHLMQNGAAGGILSGIPQNLLMPLDGAALTPGAQQIHGAIGAIEPALAPSPMPPFPAAIQQPEVLPPPNYASAGIEAGNGMHPAIRPQFTSAWQQQPSTNSTIGAEEKTVPPQISPVGAFPVPFTTTPVPLPVMKTTSGSSTTGKAVEHKKTAGSWRSESDKLDLLPAGDGTTEEDDDKAGKEDTGKVLADVPPDWTSIVEYMVADLKRGGTSCAVMR